MAEALQLVLQPDLASRVTAIQQDGFVYFPGVISPAEIAELRSVMDRLEEIPEYFDVARESWSRSFNNAFNRDEIFIQYLDKPEIIELAEKIHGADCHIIGMTAWITGPGRPETDVAYRLSAGQPTGGYIGRSAGEHPRFYYHRSFLS